VLCLDEDEGGSVWARHTYCYECRTSVNGDKPGRQRIEAQSILYKHIYLYDVTNFTYY